MRKAMPLIERTKRAAKNRPTKFVGLIDGQPVFELAPSRPACSGLRRFMADYLSKALEGGLDGDEELDAAVQVIRELIARGCTDVRPCFDK